MADYTETSSSNWFHVTDPAPLLALNADGTVIDGKTYTLDCCRFSIDVNDQVDDGYPEVQISCREPNGSLVESDGADPYGDYDLFLKLIQSVIAPGDACIIRYVGHERCDVNGGVHVVTKDAIESYDLQSLGRMTAQKLLNDPNWEE